MVAPPQPEVFTSPTARHTSLLASRHVRNAFRPAAWGLAMVEAVIGYEWLLSGLDKVLSARYLPGLADALRTSMQENRNSWWVAFIQRQLFPHAQVWAFLVEIGELLVALGFFAGTLLWVCGRFPAARWTRWLNAGVLLVLCGGVLMTANYYLMAGHGLPGLNPANPFDEGLSLDGVLTAIGLGLLLIHLLAWRSGDRSGKRAFR
jgi:thiosulfate dehydrogenase (quinone) large subunit